MSALRSRSRLRLVELLALFVLTTAIAQAAAPITVGPVVITVPQGFVAAQTQKARKTLITAWTKSVKDGSSKTFLQLTVLELAKPVTHHRTGEFRAMFNELQANLQYVFQTKQTVYTLTGKGRRALADYARTAVTLTPLKSEPLLRLLICDLVGEDVTRESLATLREDLDDLFAPVGE